MTNETMVLETYELCKSYGQVAALQSIDLRVPEGSVFALLGENGAGKTTLLKCVLNILTPSRGCARILGVDSRRINPAVLARVGYVSENQQLPAQLRIQEFFDYLRPLYPRWDRGLEQQLRMQLRLPAERRIGALSHGMRLKLALAAALPFRPRLLILDEPFSGLDPLVREELIEGFICSRGQLSVVISSHELDEVERLATHAAFLHAGRLLFLGSLPELRVHAVSKMRDPRNQQGELIRLRDIFIAMARAAHVAAPAHEAAAS
jgi:ABC-2 type transport system ATP-binding protein